MFFYTNREVLEEEITREDLNHVYIPSNFSDVKEQLMKVNGTIYYYKLVNEYHMLNELIGSYLAKFIDLDTVDYKVYKEADLIYALSEVFYQKEFRYISIKQLLEQRPDLNVSKGLCLFPSIFCCQDRLLSIFKGTSFYDNLLKVIAVDLKMGQIDRNSKNIQMKIDSKGLIDLAPVYDYSLSYCDSETSLYYGNPFMAVRKNKASLEYLFRKYPMLWDYVQQLRQVPMKKILQDVASEHKILYPQEDILLYQNHQQKNDEVIDQIKIKRFF